MVILNQDRDFVDEVREQIKASNGHCPCSLPYARNKDTKCKCKKFRDMIARGEYGYCGCGLYQNVEDDTNESTI